MRKVVFALCGFITAAGLWLALMEHLLKHSGYAARSAVDLCLAAQALAALLCVVLHAQRLFRAVVLSGGVAAALFGAWSVIHVLHATHFEGYVFLISVGLIFQGTFTVITLTSKPAATA